MTKREYTPEQRDEALKAYEEVGAAEAGRRLGISHKTISSWAKREGVQMEAPAKTTAAVEMARVTREQKREYLRELLLDQTIASVCRHDRDRYRCEAA